MGKLDAAIIDQIDLEQYAKLSGQNEARAAEGLNCLKVEGSNLPFAPHELRELAQATNPQTIADKVLATIPFGSDTEYSAKRVKDAADSCMENRTSSKLVARKAI